MRTLVEILAISALAYFTWDESLRDRVGDLTGRPVIQQATSVPEVPVVRYVQRPQPTPSGQWMWDPSRRSTLDRPAYDSHDPSQRYTDAQGRKYWYDANGIRHYDP